MHGDVDYNLDMSFEGHISALHRALFVPIHLSETPPSLFHHSLWRYWPDSPNTELLLWAKTHFLPQHLAPDLAHRHSQVTSR